MLRQPFSMYLIQHFHIGFDNFCVWNMSRTFWRKHILNSHIFDVFRKITISIDNLVSKASKLNPACFRYVEKCLNHYILKENMHFSIFAWLFTFSWGSASHPPWLTWGFSRQLWASQVSKIDDFQDECILEILTNHTMKILIKIEKIATTALK